MQNKSNNPEISDEDACWNVNTHFIVLTEKAQMPPSSGTTARQTGKHEMDARYLMSRHFQSVRWPWWILKYNIWDIYILICLSRIGS